MAAYTIKNLSDVEDQAAKHGMGEGFSARFAREALECERTGFALQSLDAGTRAPVIHKHQDAEEVYVVIAGSGRMLLGEEVKDITTHDAIRVSPEVPRSFEAGDDGLQFLVFGPHHANDGEILKTGWPS